MEQIQKFCPFIKDYCREDCAFRLLDDENGDICYISGFITDFWSFKEDFQSLKEDFASVIGTKKQLDIRRRERTISYIRTNSMQEE